VAAKEKKSNPTCRNSTTNAGKDITMPLGLECVATATGNSSISPQTGPPIAQEQKESTNLSKELCTQCPVTGEKVKGRARDFACSVQNVHCMMAALVLQEAPRQSKSPNETENCFRDIADQIGLFFSWLEQGDWREKLAGKMAQIPSSAHNSEELQQMTDRLAEGPLGYDRRFRAGLGAFLTRSADIHSEACKPITDAIQKSLKRHHSVYDSVSEKLFASAESTDQVLHEVYKWCKGQDLPGTKGSESDVTQRSERVQIMALLANVSGDPGKKKDVMQIVATAFSQPCESGDLNTWLLCLGPANKVILGWTDFLPENAREKIKRRLKLIDQARLEIDPQRWEVDLNTWVGKAARGEKRLEAANIIKKIMESGFESKEKIVDLRNLNLKTLPGAIGVLKDAKPKQLYFDNNRLNQPESLPASVGLLTDVTFLDLQRNRLKRVPESIEPLTKMSTLRLSENELKTLPAWIGSLNRLYDFLISNNDFRTFPRIALPNLGHITIDHCSMNELNESFEVPLTAEIFTEEGQYPVGRKQSASCVLL
jgi:hypothetical protein